MGRGEEGKKGEGTKDFGVECRVTVKLTDVGARAFCTKLLHSIVHVTRRMGTRMQPAAPHTCGVSSHSSQFATTLG